MAKGATVCLLEVKLSRSVTFIVVTGNLRMPESRLLPRVDAEERDERERTAVKRVEIMVPVKRMGWNQDKKNSILLSENECGEKERVQDGRRSLERRNLQFLYVPSLKSLTTFGLPGLTAERKSCYGPDPVKTLSSFHSLQKKKFASLKAPPGILGFPFRDGRQ